MMNKRLLKLVVVITVMALGFEAVAQSDIALATRKAQLLELSSKLKQRDQNNRQVARDYARRAGIAVRRELPNGGVMELQRIAPGVGPVFYITNNLDAADSVSSDEIRPGRSAGLSLEGDGMTVAEWDGGAIYNHSDFIGRLTQVDNPSAVSGHSTHVAGTLIGAGDGLEPRSKGMAYKAHLDAYDWNSDTAEMAAAAATGLLISNHSYGIAAGWIYTGALAPETWLWIGGEADTDIEDPNFGYYDSESQLWDQIAFDAPYYLIVKAAGNDRSDIGPSPGEQYTIINQDGVEQGISTLPRNADCAPAGYDCLPTNSVAKNVLTVGAVDDVPGGYSPLAGPAQVLMAPFSSWGPSDDGRIKPDVMGNGVFLISAWHTSPFYAAAAGTSMAAPNVTGSLLLLQEHYEDINGIGNFMRSATLKALAIHTADESGSADGPDYAFGWGMINTNNAAEVITEDGGDHQIIEDNLANGAVNSIPLTITQADAFITVTLVWMDRPGPVVAPSLDPTDLILVNDLDLRIKIGPSTYFPWVLDPDVPAAAATRADNFRDNVEQVEVANADIGTYSIEVSHKGILFSTESQNYSLIISVTSTPPAPIGLILDEDFSGGFPVGWSVDTVLGVPWAINTPVSGDSRLNNFTGGTGQFAMVDNNYVNNTLTSLRTPVYDLSGNTGAVFRFNSASIYDTFESLNVDVTNDGGSSWFNVWSWQGFSLYPVGYDLDISSVAAGESAVMVRFRFTSNGWLSGDFWQVDNVELEVYGGGPPIGSPPGQATSPSPANTASGLGIETVLFWNAGIDATSHNVYFGTSASLNGAASKGNQGGTGYDPGTLVNSTTYYWRIDEVNDDGTTAGTLWSFTTVASSTPVQPGQASEPNPVDGAIDFSSSPSLGWTSGADSTSHDVYFGTSTSPAFQGNQTDNNYSPGTLADATTYYWRVDEVNDSLKTTGPVWSFTTLAAVSLSFHISSINVSDEQVKGPRRRAVATVTVQDSFGVAVSGVSVSGTFSGDWDGALSGTSDGSGEIILATPAVKNGSIWNFCVNAASKSSWSFDQSINASLLCGAPPPPPPPATTGSIAGLVIDVNSGSPVSGAAVSVDSGETDTTTAAGSYILTGVATGPRTVTVSASGYDSASSTTQVEDGLTSNLDISLNPVPVGGGTGTLKGTVLSSGGAKLSGVTVQVVGGASGTTNKGGKYTVQNVPEGLQSVVATHASGQSWSGPVTIVTATTTTLNIRLNP